MRKGVSWRWYEIVISDRYLDDTRVFQTVTNPGADVLIEGIVKFCGIPEADHTFLIDVETAVARARLNSRAGFEPDRFEIMGNEFDENVRRKYLAIAEANQHRITVVDGSGSPDDVFRAVEALVRQHL